MNARFLYTLPKNRKTILILAANEAPRFTFVGTTLQVDDNRKCNYYVTVHKGSKQTTIFVDSRVSVGAYFLGFCFNVSELSDYIDGGFCFSNVGDGSIRVFSQGKDDVDGCGCF
jgi:hypothetical protein